MSAIKILKIRSRDTDPDSLPYKKIRLSDKEERDLSLAMDSLDHLIDIHKDKSNSLYNLITGGGKRDLDPSYHFQKSS